MTESNAWKVAREACAKEADCDGGGGGEYNAGYEDGRQRAAEYIRSLPMPPAFRAAVEAEMGEVVERTAAEILRKINRAEAEIEEYIEDDTGLAPLEAALEELSAARALLSRLDAKGESHD